jgi:hypothetical protein
MKPVKEKWTRIVFQTEYSLKLHMGEPTGLPSKRLALAECHTPLHTNRDREGRGPHPPPGEGTPPPRGGEGGEGGRERLEEWSCTKRRSCLLQMRRRLQEPPTIFTVTSGGARKGRLYSSDPQQKSRCTVAMDTISATRERSYLTNDPTGKRP